MIEKQVGVVSWFNDKLGYGFITPDEDGSGKVMKDVFVHFSGVSMEGFKTLNAGDRVSFVVAQGEKGPQAEFVEKL